MARGNCPRPETGTVVSTRPADRPGSPCRPRRARPGCGRAGRRPSPARRRARSRRRRRPCAPSRRARRAPSPFRFAAARRQIDARHVPGRRQSEDARSRQVRSAARTERREVDGDFIEPRQIRRRQRQQRLTPHRAMITPPMPASIASTALSVSICRIRRSRPAPTAARTTSSRPRAAARASSRLATLAQAISSTNATAASSTNSVCRVSPTTTSCSGTTAMPFSPLLSGILLRQPSGDAVISAWACATDAPGASRPTPR